jgi:hypothetical protein
MPYDGVVASRSIAVDPRCEDVAIAELAPGDAVQVYSWSQREWLTGTYEVDYMGAPFIALHERPPLRYEAAMLMGLRRLLH